MTIWAYKAALTHKRLIHNVFSITEPPSSIKHSSLRSLVKTEFGRLIFTETTIPSLPRIPFHDSHELSVIFNVIVGNFHLEQ